MKSTMISRSLTNLFLIAIAVAVALPVILLYAANNRHAHTEPPISNSTSTATDHPQEGTSCTRSGWKLLNGCEGYLKGLDTDPGEYCCPAMRSVARNRPDCVCEIYYVATLVVNPNIDPLKPLAVIDYCNIARYPRMPDCKALILGEDYSATSPSSSSPWTYRAWVCVLLYVSLVFFSSVIVLWIR
ncbi:unnamed protein product [Linum trigynum]|uniref:Bifunctional inhibitor/plant lipid transfer protein/seed storage helical domain-containing protein n=1 Tax=Linum trigynum TaxID=586398 RepID=A0AAV2GQC2_9ROSI